MLKAPKLNLDNTRETSVIGDANDKADSAHH